MLRIKFLENRFVKEPREHMSAIFRRIAAVSGATSVGLAAYGAHGFKPETEALK